jgi:hypothetical protein
LSDSALKLLFQKTPDHYIIIQHEDNHQYFHLSSICNECFNYINIIWVQSPSIIGS